jgi:hypothetical protein
MVHHRDLHGLGLLHRNRFEDRQPLPAKTTPGVTLQINPMGSAIDSAIQKKRAKARRIVPVAHWNRKVWAWETIAPNLTKRYIVMPQLSGRQMKQTKAYYEKLWGPIKLRRCAFTAIK